MNWHTIDWKLYAGLTMAAAGALALVIFWLAVVGGIALRLFELCAGRAQFARNSRRGRRRRSAPAMVRYRDDGDRVPLDSLLSNGASDSTDELPVVVDHGP